MKRGVVAVWACLMILLAVGAVAGLSTLVGGSAGGTLASGRSIVAHSNSWRLSTRFRGDTATIETAGRIIIVEPSAIVVDDEIYGRLEESVSAVVIHVHNGELQVTADGQPVVAAD